MLKQKTIIVNRKYYAKAKTYIPGIKHLGFTA